MRFTTHRDQQRVKWKMAVRYKIMMKWEVQVTKKVQHWDRVHRTSWTVKRRQKNKTDQEDQTGKDNGTTEIYL